jgi:hypothetical protein
MIDTLPGLFFQTGHFITQQAETLQALHGVQHRI